MKRFMMCLLLIACFGFQVMPIASAAGEITAAQLDAVGMPSDGNLISSAGLSKTGSGYALPPANGDVLDLSLGCYGDYKIITYSPSTGLFYYASQPAPSVFDDFISVIDEDAPLELKSTSSMGEAFAMAMYVSPDVPEFSIGADTGAYALFIPYSDSIDTVSSLSGVEYACKVSDLVKHVVPVEEYNRKDTTPSTVTATLVEKITENDVVTAAKYKVTFSLGNKGESATLLLVNNSSVATPSGNSGSVEFTLKNLENKVYEVALVVNSGNRYKTTIEVDFAEGYNPQKVTASDAEPIVTFKGLPEAGETGRTDVLYVTMETLNVPTKMRFDDADLTPDYTTSVELQITNNGEYRYIAISEMGRVAEGTLTINCFAPGGAQARDPLSNPVSYADGDRLVQTGMESPQNNTALAAFGVVGFSVALAGIGLYLYKNRRDNA